MIGMRWLSGRKPMDTEVLGIPLSRGVEYLCACIVALEGLVLAGISGNMIIDGFGGLSGKWVAAAGGQLVLLAFAFMVFWVLRSELSYNRKKMALFVAVFLLLMLPPALLF